MDYQADDGFRRPYHHAHHPDQASTDGTFTSDATVAGLTMGEWTGLWWATVLQSDIAHNIVIGADPADAELGDLGAVHLLGGLFAPADENGDLGAIARSFGVDSGDAILVPVLNFVDIEGDAFGTPAGIDPVARLDEIIGNWIDSIDWDNTRLFVDGLEIDLASHLHRTGVYEMGRVQEGTVASDSLGAPLGEDMDLGMAAGIMVMLQPLSAGEHEIAWEGTTRALADATGDAVPGTSDFHYEVHDTIIVG